MGSAEGHGVVIIQRKMELRHWHFSVALTFLLCVEWAKAEECVPLSNCTSLLALWTNRHNIPGRNVHQVAQTLREAHCGRQNNQPLVLCNDEEEEEEEVLEPHSRENLIRSGALVGMEGSHSCRGSVKLMHYNNNFGDVKTLRLKGGAYRNIRRLEDRQVFNAENHGNCCYKLYELPRFRGNSGNLIDEPPTIQPKSLKRILC